jgi:hypothetical protein
MKMKQEEEQQQHNANLCETMFRVVVAPALFSTVMKIDFFVGLLLQLLLLLLCMHAGICCRLNWRTESTATDMTIMHFEIYLLCNNLRSIFSSLFSSHNHRHDLPQQQQQQQLGGG